MTGPPPVPVGYGYVVLPSVTVVPIEMVVVTGLVIVPGDTCEDELGELIVGEEVAPKEEGTGRIEGDGTGIIEGEVGEVEESETTEEEADADVGRIEDDVEMEADDDRVLTEDDSEVTVTVDAATEVVTVELAVTVAAAEIVDETDDEDATLVVVDAATELEPEVSGCGGGRLVAIAVVVDRTVAVTVGVIVILVGFAPPPLHDS